MKVPFRKVWGRPIEQWLHDVPHFAKERFVPFKCVVGQVVHMCVSAGNTHGTPGHTRGVATCILAQHANIIMTLVWYPLSPFR